MSKFFINRPIVAMVIAIFTVIVGAVVALGLPVALFPQIAPPEVQKRSYSDAVHFHWCPHAELFPVNRIKRDLKLSAYRGDLPGFLTCLLLLISNVPA